MKKRRRIASPGLSSKVLSYLMKRGHRQAKVDRLLGVTEGYISLVKSKQRSFTLEHLVLLADGIGMPMGEMLIQATERPHASKKVREQMDRIAHIVRIGDKALEAIRAHQRKKRRRVA